MVLQFIDLIQVVKFVTCEKKIRVGKAQAARKARKELGRSCH